MPDKRAHAVITGRVQGVGYRWTTYRRAKSLGLTGWVRNRPDGSVEAVFEGAEADVRSMIDWCREGPSSAIVEDVDVEWLDARGDYVDFDIAF